MSTSKPGQPPGGGQGGSGNPYARFIPKEELGSVQAWNPQTFAAPGNRAAEGEGGIRKPTLAERAAAEVKPFGRPGAANTAPQTGVKPEAVRPAAAHAPQPKPAPRRPVVGGVPGEESIPEPQPEVAPKARRGRKRGAR